MKIYTIVSPHEKLAIDKINELLSLCHLTKADMVQYDMEEISLSEAILDVSTAPFLTERKAVLIKNPFFLTGATVKGMEQDPAILEKYVESPDERNVLIIYAPYEKLDDRKKIVKLLKKKTNFITLSNLTDIEKIDTIRRELAMQRIAFADDLPKLLFDLTKGNYDFIQMELEKIKDYFGTNANRQLTYEILMALVPRTLEDNVFLLTEALVTKNKVQAHHIYSDLITQKEEPVKLIALIANQFRLIQHTQKLQGYGMNERAMAEMIKVHPYRVKLAINHGRRFRQAEVDKIIAQLAQMDISIKTGKIDAHTALELFILSL